MVGGARLIGGGGGGSRGMTDFDRAACILRNNGGSGGLLPSEVDSAEHSSTVVLKQLSMQKDGHFFMYKRTPKALKVLVSQGDGRGKVAPGGHRCCYLPFVSLNNVNQLGVTW